MRNSSSTQFSSNHNHYHKAEHNNNVNVNKEENDNEKDSTSTMVSATTPSAASGSEEMQARRQGRPPQSRRSPPVASPTSSTSSESSSASPSPPFNSSSTSSFRSQTFPTRLYVNTLYKSGPKVQQARRIKWTPELQDRFLRCVERLGKTAVPSRILAEMNVEGLSRSQVASHLHQFRKQTEQEEQQMYEIQPFPASGSSQLVPSSTLSTYRHDQELFSGLSTSALFPSVSIESTYDTNYSDFYVRMIYQNTLLQRSIPSLSGSPSYLLPPSSEQQQNLNPSESPLDYLNLVDDFWAMPNSTTTTASTALTSDWNHPPRNPSFGL